MQGALSLLQERLAPAEDIFFRWLVRVFMAGVLVGCAWIDDAPPLELAAMIITFYVVVRVAMQLPSLASAAPFENRVLKLLFAILCLILLGLSFIVVVIFVESIALHISAAS